MKKLFSILLLLLALTVSLCACGDNSNPGGNTNDPPSDEKVIYAPGTDLTIVTSGDVDASVTTALTQTLSKAHGRMPRVVQDTAEKTAHEIVIGETSRAISDAAYKLLTLPSYNEASYAIYSDGESIAIAYYGEDDVSLDIALEYLTENYFTSDKLVLDAGIVKYEEIDLDAYFQAIDEEFLKAEWAALAESVGGGEKGEKLVAAMKDLYTLYDDSMIDWFANLYDPETGGYYYSNSGRDNQGYLPDIESTAQALKFITTSGLAKTIGDGTYVSAISDEMKTQIVTFIKGLQDPNGYFYHPQWTRAVNSQTSRLARDLGNAVGVLHALGSAPTYNTPNGDKGDGLLVDGTPVAAAAYLTGRLGGSAAVAVSQVVATSTTYMKELENKETFLAYLDSLDITHNSYGAGNTLTSITSQIVTRDKALKEAGADYSLMDILIEYLNERQNPENGTWHAENNYYAVNGLMKTSGVYSKAGVMLPYATKALKSAIDAITSEEKIDSVTSIYNTWFTILRIRNITKNSGSDAEKAEIGAMLEEMVNNAPTLLAATKAKVAVFKKDDGSFSYTPNASSANSQGCPVALPNTNEGDVNATVICSSDILVYIYGALGLSDKSVSIYTYNDWRRYSHLLENLPPIVKKEEIINDEIFTFEDDTLGDIPTGISVSQKSGEGSICVVEDGRGGKAVQITSTSGVNDSATIHAGSRVTSKSCFIFEADFRLDSSETTYPIQIFMGEAYMFTIRTANGKVSIVESSSGTSKYSVDNNLKLTPEFGEWFNIRVEYYVGTAEDVRIKFYYNKELVAVTDNYYDKNGVKLSGTSEPSTVYENAQIFVVKAGVCKLLFDNVRAYKTDDKYVAEPDKDLVINVDGKSPEDKKRAEITSSIPENLETYYKNNSIAGTRYDFTDNTFTKYSGANPNGMMIEEFNDEAKKNMANGKFAPDLSYDDLYIKASGWAGIGFANQGETSANAGDKYIVEMNFTYLGGTPSKASDPKPAFFGFYSTNTITNKGMADFAYMSFVTNDPDALILGDVELKRNTTYNIRIEHTVGAGYEIYVNGQLAGGNSFEDTAGVSDTTMLGFGFYFRARMSDPLEFIIDDMYIGIVKAN